MARYLIDAICKGIRRAIPTVLYDKPVAGRSHFKDSSNYEAQTWLDGLKESASRQATSKYFYEYRSEFEGTKWFATLHEGAG